MTGAVHGHSHRAIHFLREHPATLAVFWIYVSRTNKDNVAWSSLRGLVKSTGWSINECTAGRDWLIDHEALEVISDYVRPDWRKLPESQRKRKIALDRTLYCRPTGYLKINGDTYPLLYFGASEPAPELEEGDVSQGETSQGETSKSKGKKRSKRSDVSQGETSQPTMSHRDDVRPGETELDSYSELDSFSSELGSSSNLGQPPQQDDAAVHLTPAQLRGMGMGALLTPEHSPSVAKVKGDPLWLAYCKAIGGEPALTHGMAEIILGKIVEYQRIGVNPEEVEKLVASKLVGRSKPYEFNYIGSDIFQFRAVNSSMTYTPSEQQSPAVLDDLTRQIASTLPDTPPDAYLPNLPLEMRQRHWADMGRRGTAKRMAKERLGIL
jgi:hypothetical protein